MAMLMSMKRAPTAEDRPCVCQPKSLEPGESSNKPLEVASIWPLSLARPAQEILEPLVKRSAPQPETRQPAHLTEHPCD